MTNSTSHPPPIKRAIWLLAFALTSLSLTGCEEVYTEEVVYTIVGADDLSDDAQNAINQARGSYGPISVETGDSQAPNHLLLQNYQNGEDPISAHNQRWPDDPIAFTIPVCGGKLILGGTWETRLDIIKVASKIDENLDPSC